MTHLSDRLDALEQYADRTAIIEPLGRQISFGDLREAVHRRAAGLSERGMGPGHRVVLLLPMGIELYISLLALLHAGCTVVLVDPQNGTTHLKKCLNQFEIHGLIGSPKAHLLRLILPALRGGLLYASPYRLPFTDSLRSLQASPQRRPITSSAPALITFTTGSTGTPKAMGRSHAFLMAQHLLLTTHMKLRPGEVDLATLPVFLLNSLAAGATCVLPAGDLQDISSLPWEKIARQIRTHSVSTTSGSPSFFQALCDWLKKNDLRLPQLKRVFVGGARVSSQLLHAMYEVLPNTSIEIIYGSTEAEPIATIDGQQFLAQSRSGQVGVCAGRPVPGLSLSIREVEDLTPCKTDEFGEIWVSGPHVNTHYYKSARADHQNKVNDGGRIWHRTGDGGYLDSDGLLWLIGRTTARVGPYFPFPVEEQAEAMDGVTRAALMSYQQRPLLVYSGIADEQAVEQTLGFPVHRLAQIPVDKRHRAKVDRVRLMRLLDDRKEDRNFRKK